MAQQTITIKGAAYRVTRRVGDHIVLTGPRGGTLILTREIGENAKGEFGYTGRLHCYRPSGGAPKRAHSDLAFREVDGRIVFQ